MVREKLRIFIERRNIQNFIVGLIVFNSIIIGLETWPVYMEKFGHLTDEIDLVILALFIAEILIKFYVYRLSFFTSAWNIFDASVVLISVLPAAGSFSVFRALRIVRTLRLLNNLPKLKLIIESLLLSLPSIGWILVLLSIIFYIFAVIGNNLFGTLFPEYFGSFSKALFSLFQIMTLESWSSGIARPVLKEFPLASVYFVTFILIATYTTLNIFIAIVVNTMNEINREQIKSEEKQMLSTILQEIKLEEKMLKDDIVGEIKHEEDVLKATIHTENKIILDRLDKLSADVQLLMKQIKKN